MFDREKPYQSNNDMNDLKSKLKDAEERVENQEQIIQISKEIISRNGRPGIIPPHTQQTILDRYKKDVSQLQARIRELMSEQKKSCCEKSI